jgi:hypothetical protein
VAAPHRTSQTVQRGRRGSRRVAESASWPGGELLSSTAARAVTLRIVAALTAAAFQRTRDGERHFVQLFRTSGLRSLSSRSNPGGRPRSAGSTRSWRAWLRDAGVWRAPRAAAAAAQTLISAFQTLPGWCASVFWGSSGWPSGERGAALVCPSRPSWSGRRRQGGRVRRCPDRASARARPFRVLQLS